MSDDQQPGRGPGNPPPSSEPSVTDDAGSQALSEALRSSFVIVKFVMIVLVILFLCSGIFVVGPQERKIVLRLGKPVGQGELLGPGLHWSWPAPIDEVVTIPFAGSQTVVSTVGWYHTTPEQEAANQEQPPGPSLNPAVDGYAITSDGNIIHTRATLKYRVDDPILYEFGFASASNAVQDALDNAILHAAARFSVDDVLTGEIERFRETIQARVSQLIASNKLGIVIEQCDVRSIPPRQLKPAFEGVTAAISMSDTVRNDALKDETFLVNKSTAEAATITNKAQAERVRLVGAVKAQADVFNELLPRYETNASLVVNFLLMNKIARVLTNAQDKIYLPERADGAKRELRLQLSREPAAPKSAGPAPSQSIFD